MSSRPVLFGRLSLLEVKEVKVVFFDVSQLRGN